jgi:phage terminase large subunit-like protein
MPTTTQRRKPKLEGWDAVRAKRDKFTAQQWADALANAGDYASYEFSLGPNPAVAFIDNLTHTGDFSGQAFELQLWQEAILRLIFDTDGMPRYRYVFIGLPRKNGKTELVGAIVCYLLFGTGIRAQNIYSASGDAKQAGLIHKAAAAMIQQNQSLNEAAQVYKGNVKRILFEPLGSEYEALSSEAYSKFGLRPSVNLYDEVHVFPNAELHSSLETAFGATKKPCSIYITTAGHDQTSLCYELWQRAREAMKAPGSDPKFLGILYEFREGDDWQDEAVWRRINPGLGTFRSLEDMREQMDGALKSAIKENDCRQFYLNQWTNQAVRWINEDAWKSCGETYFRPSIDMPGEPCYAGYDHGITGDMACVALVWPTLEGVRCWVHGWVPRNGKWKEEIRNKDRYPQWERDGYITFTTGLRGDQVVDEPTIEKDIARLHELFPIRSLFADRAYANTLLIHLLNNHMINVKGITQGPITMNEACVKLEEMVISRTIEHADNPVLNWNIGNASMKRTPQGLMQLDKSSSTERIDGLAALLNALAAMCADPENRTPCIYDQPGKLSLG